MSDFGRKDLGDKVSEAVKPDAAKSDFDKAKETVTDKVDSFVGSNTTDNNKSFAQTASDKFSSATSDAKDAASDKQSSASDSANSYLDAAKKEAGKAADYVSNLVNGEKN